MIRRHREILSKILNADGCISVHKLADFCDVSTRTIQLDVKEINSQLKKYNIQIDSIIKKGYYFTEEIKKIIIENNIISSILDYEYIMEAPATPLERQMCILLNLTVEEQVDVDELEENMYISTSTLRKDIDNAKKWLKENLNIDYSFSKGTKFNYAEKDKRNIISWVIGKRINISTMTKYWNYVFREINTSKYFDILYHIVDEEAKKFDFYLSGNNCQLFTAEILIAIRRYRLGYNLEEDDSSTEELMPIIICLKEKIQSYFNVVLPEIEWINLQHYFKSKQLVSGTNIKQIETKESIYIINEFFRIIYDKFNLDLSSHNTVKENLLLYIIPMINRLKFKHCIASPINEDVINNYPLEYKMAMEMSYIIKEVLNLDMNPTELSYITMHLVATNEFWNKKLNTIIVCDFDECIITLIKNKVFKYLGEKIQFCGCYTYQQFIIQSEKGFKQVDLIITTSTLAGRTKIPFIQISTLVDLKDILNLHEYLEHFET